MRVLVTGVGGELGYRVASLLERDPAVTDLAGLDARSPRRRVRSMRVFNIEPTDRRHLLRAVQDFSPTAVVHLGSWEPDARVAPRPAAERTSAMAIAVLGAAADLPAVDRFVIRSDIAVYGRARGSAMVPDESVPPVPTTPWGRSLLEVERLGAAAGRAAGVPVTSLRFAPLMGDRFPSPLARYLRLPVVGFSALADPAFSVLELGDAAAAVMAALHRRPDGPLNVVGPGAVTVSQAARLGRRLPVPVLGPEWALWQRVAGVARVGLPGHLLELIHRGRTADGMQAESALGLMPARTPDVVRSMFGWSPPAELRVVRGAA
ncbi:MAG: UDP-glucose 4-epimerase [Acidimicrobiaceae bacterium]|nr:UDP-glucose 4-epimerase [Acidimicrobiaceae bacterium]